MLCAQVTASTHLLDHLDYGEQFGEHCTVCLVGKQLDHACPAADSPLVNPLSVEPARDLPGRSTHLASACALPGQRAPPAAIPSLP